MTPAPGDYDNLYVFLGTGAVLVVCGAAVLFGSMRQRLAGLLQAADVFGILLLAAGVQPDDRLYLMDLKALLVLVVYGVMCFRWPDRWVILLTGLQGFAVLLHVSDLLDVSLPRSVNGLFLNAIGWAMLLVLATSTAVHVLNRFDRRDARA
ncbi:hypothetical protein [Brevundimonas sp.]|uniref:hypothetical protein n=1 Tax=Brevundimonas sp. TaxID=1871086 RepID=UPI003D14A0B6